MMKTSLVPKTGLNNNKHVQLSDIFRHGPNTKNVKENLDFKSCHWLHMFFATMRKSQRFFDYICYYQNLKGNQKGKDQHSNLYILKAWILTFKFFFFLKKFNNLAMKIQHRWVYNVFKFTRELDQSVSKSLFCHFRNTTQTFEYLFVLGLKLGVILRVLHLTQ